MDDIQLPTELSQLNQRPTSFWVCHTGGSPAPQNNCQSAVDLLMERGCTYVDYFRFVNPQNQRPGVDKNRTPTVDLEYPNSGSKESFILLRPKVEDHYNPILEAEGSLRAIIQSYLTPIQQALFGPMPKGGPIFDWRDKYSPRRTDMKPPGNKPQADYLLAVQNAIETHDGPAFLHAFTAINSILQQLKCSTSHPENALIQAVRGWSSLPKVVVLRVMTETYNRCVIPHWKELKQYQAFSSEVYGELMPSLVYKICQHTALGEHSLFVDLGSGVGNVVAQASLQTGCRSFGIEIQPNRASIACDAMNDFRARCHMWGLQPGEIELAEGDMRSNSRVHDLVKQADVVLVNNLIFEENLHQAINTQFLDKVKPGAYVVCLRTFGRFRQKTQEKRPECDVLSRSFACEEHEYEPDDISWGPKGGTYYVYRRREQPSQGEYLLRQPEEANSRSAAFLRGVATSCAQADLQCLTQKLSAAEAEQSSLVYRLSQKLARNPTHPPIATRPARVERLPDHDDDAYTQGLKEELEAAQAEQLGLLCQMSSKLSDLIVT